VTWLEHHANIVPWQQLCLETGARLRVSPVDDNGDILLDEYEKLLGPRTRIVALPLVSNALGTVTPAYEMIAAAHRHGALALVDGAQSVSHRRTDVQALDADFFVLSGHKMFAPTGIGAVYAKLAILETMPPWQGGGNMIADVTFEKTVYQSAPGRFEAGTGNIADAVGLGAAIDYLDAVGMEAIARHEHALIERRSPASAPFPGCASSARRASAQAWCPSCSTAAAPRMWARRLTARGSRCARAITAPSRSCAASGSKVRCAPRSRSTTPPRTSKPSLRP
jgi:cysteine desulfurase/selenocysteine lyase